MISLLYDHQNPYCQFAQELNILLDTTAQVKNCINKIAHPEAKSPILVILVKIRIF